VAETRFQLIKGRMRAPDPGETNARICDKDVEQPLRSSRGNALFLVSYYLSHVVHSDKLSHNEHSYLLSNKTMGIPLLYLCPMECLFVKYNDLAGLLTVAKKLQLSSVLLSYR
jgi:hypothetical protein